MQARFLGDIGDYGKYALLRTLSAFTEGQEHRTVAVIWYANRSDGSRAISRFRYLHDADDARVDSELHEALRTLDALPRRTFLAVQRLRILPPTTRYYNKILPRGRERTAWLDGAVRMASGRDIVYLDPDNGLASTSTGSRRHATLDEVAAFAEVADTVVFYHHLSRRNSHEYQQCALLARVTDAMPHRSVIVMRFRPGGGRCFVVLTVRERRQEVETRLRALERIWRDRFILQAGT